jgi:hypothetical protein
MHCKPLNLDNLTVRTTARESFTGQEHREMALLVYKRFGRNLESATAAWQRMLQNSCTEQDFAELAGLA